MGETNTITETVARATAETALQRAGLDERQAELVADALLDAELRGRPTHGLIRLPPLCAKLSAGEPRGPIQVRQHKGGCLLLDAAGELGYLVAAAAVDRAAILAGVHGVGLVGASGTNHAGATGYYARRGAARGVAITLMTNCYPQVAPFGASSPVFGTNPLAAAFPTEGEPLVIDFSTAAVTIGQLRVSLEAGEQIASGLAYDAAGAPTTDPRAALDGGAVAAFGGVKGSAMALWIQLMTTALIGATPLPPRGAEYGLTVLAFDPSQLGGRERYAESVSAIRRAVAGARPLSEEGRVLLPGQRGDEAVRLNRREGIILPTSLWEEICALSDSD